MRIPIALLACAVALVACQEATPEPTDAPQPTAASSTTAPGERVELSYVFETGQILVYDVDMNQRMLVSTQGDPEQADMPSDADLTVRGSGRFTYEVADGPREGTHRLLISGEFDDLSVEGTLDGEPIEDPADARDLGIGEPVAGEIVVDAHGRPLDDEPESAVADLSTDLARFPGPVLPADPVAVGETWEVTHAETALGSVPVETTVTGSIAESADQAVTVEAESVTSEGEVDLAAFYRDFLTGVGGEDEPVGGLEDIVFRILVDPGAGTVRASLDPVTGRVLQSTREASTALTMEIVLPDETTGEPDPFEMRLETDQTIEYRLVEDPGG